MSIDTEEMVKAQPMDGVVLVRDSVLLLYLYMLLKLTKIGGCDKVDPFTRQSVDTHIL